MIVVVQVHLSFLLALADTHAAWKKRRTPSLSCLLGLACLFHATWRGNSPSPFILSTSLSLYLMQLVVKIAAQDYFLGLAWLVSHSTWKQWSSPCFSIFLTWAWIVSHATRRGGILSPSVLSFGLNLSLMLLEREEAAQVSESCILGLDCLLCLLKKVGQPKCIYLISCLWFVYHANWNGRGTPCFLVLPWFSCYLEWE